jgi:hypothetical protein
MELAISVMLVAKIMGFLAGSLFLALAALLPINDTPTSRTQFTIWFILEVILFAVIFGFVSFKVVA